MCAARRVALRRPGGGRPARDDRLHVIYQVIVSVGLPSQLPLLGGLVGDAHLSGVLAQLHANRAPQNYPKHNKDDFWLSPLACVWLPSPRRRGAGGEVPHSPLGAAAASAAGSAGA